MLHRRNGKQLAQLILSPHRGRKWRVFKLGDKWHVADPQLRIREFPYFSSCVFFLRNRLSQ